MRIVVSGITGFIGSRLRSYLEEEGHEVLGLSRGFEEAIHWDLSGREIDSGGLEGTDAVIHLAGENIASGRWTRAKRKAIRDSRVEGTRFLVETLKGLKRPPRVLICASAIGYYGSRGEEILDESSEPGGDFLAQVCQEWEEACRSAAECGIRSLSLRIGVVLSPRGGALKKMLPLFRLGLGGRLGNGRQYFSWIDLEDAVAAVSHCLAEESIKGPVNLVAPHPVTNREFTQTLGRVLKRPTPFPVPPFMLEAVLGREAARALLLSSTRVLPRVLTDSGFQFQYPFLEEGLRHQLEAG